MDDQSARDTSRAMEGASDSEKAGHVTTTDSVFEENMHAAVGSSDGRPQSDFVPRPSLQRKKSRIERLPSVALNRHQGHAKTFILSGWQSGLAGSVVNLCSTILGTGVLALPMTGVRLGLVPMIAMLLLLGWANAYSCNLLLLVGGFTNLYTFEEVTERTMGYAVARFLDVCILVRSIIVLTSILIFTGDFLSSLTEATFDQFSIDLSINKSVLICVMTLLVIYPLALMRSMNSLAGFSFFKLVCLGAFVAVVSYLSMQSMWVGDVAHFSWAKAPSWNWLRALPVAAFSYHSQVNLFPVYAEVKRPTLRKGGHMIALAYAFCSALFIAVSAFGYLQFPTSSYGNYLRNYSDDVSGSVIHVLRASFLIVTVFTFPMQLFAARIAVHSLVWAHQEKMSGLQSFLITTLVTALALGGCLITDDIALVLGVGGSIFTSYVSMILPAQIYLKVLNVRSEGDGGLLSPRDRWTDQIDLDSLLDDEGSVQVASAFKMATHPSQIKYEKLKAWLLLLTGLVVGIAGLIATLLLK